MASTPPHASRASDTSAAAIRRLTEQGYEATTAEDLAESVGLSRSTFFRRFGSKDDVIFADHDHALAQLEAFLARTTMPPGGAMIDGATDVMRLLIRDPEAARLRFELVRHTPALRDRELIITHRYERVFSSYLTRVLHPETPGWVPTALAASVVAVHNTTLRDWLRGRIPDAIRAAAQDLHQLTTLFDRQLSPGNDEERHRVVVAVFDAVGSPDAVLGAVAAQLSAASPPQSRQR